MACVVSIPSLFYAHADAKPLPKSYTPPTAKPSAVHPLTIGDKQKSMIPLITALPAQKSVSGWYLGIDGDFCTNKRHYNRAVTKSSINQVSSHMAALIDAKRILSGVSLLAGYGRHTATLSSALSSALSGRGNFSSHYVTLGLGLRLGWQITQSHSLCAFTNYRLGIRILRGGGAYADVHDVMKNYQNSAIAAYLEERFLTNSPLVIDNELSNVLDTIISSGLLESILGYFSSRRRPNASSGSRPSTPPANAGSSNTPLPAIDSWSYSAIVLPYTQHIEYGLEYAYTLKRRYRFAVSIGGMHAMHHFFSGIHISGSLSFRVA